MNHSAEVYTTPSGGLLITCLGKGEGMIASDGSFSVWNSEESRYSYHEQGDAAEVLGALLSDPFPGGQKW